MGEEYKVNSLQQCLQSREVHISDRELWKLACEVVDEEGADQEAGLAWVSDSAFRDSLVAKALVFCYLKGKLRSSEVLDVLTEEQVFKVAFGGDFPTVEFIKKFRRTARLRLEKCLVEIIRQSPDFQATYLDPDQPCEFQARELLDRATRLDMMDGDD